MILQPGALGGEAADGVAFKDLATLLFGEVAGGDAEGICLAVVNDEEFDADLDGLDLQGHGEPLEVGGGGVLGGEQGGENLAASDALKLGEDFGGDEVGFGLVGDFVESHVVFVEEGDEDLAGFGPGVDAALDGGGEGEGLGVGEGGFDAGGEGAHDVC